MAKENREAEHMLGHNDPKQNNTKKEKRETNEESMSSTKTMSISQQAAQAMPPSSAALRTSREEHCFCLLTMSTQNVTRERKNHN